jgi:hypothetical protein
MSGKPCFHRNRNGDGRQAGKSEPEALAWILHTLIALPL